MSAPPVYGQQPGYGPPPSQQNYGPPNGQPGPAQGQPQYAGPQQYGPPAGQPQNYGPPNVAQGLGSPTQQSDDASSFFDGASGSPAISFPRGEYNVWKGGIFTGVIVKKQAKNFDTKKPDFWDSGDPVIDVVVEVLTQDRDGNNPLDDGRRRMFITQKDTHILDSMASVVKEATRQGFHRGGQLWLCKTTQRKGEKSDRNVWQASYIPPTADTLRLLDTLAPQGVSQQAADEVAAQASYSQPQGGNPYQQGPQNGQAGPPLAYNAPPQGQPVYQGPPSQQGYQGQPGYQQEPPGGQAVPPGQWGQPAPQQGYQQQPAPEAQNPWSGQPPVYQGQPHQTGNPYYPQQ